MLDRIMILLCLLLGTAGLAACGGSSSNDDAITATDLDAAAESVISEMLPEIASELDVASVKTDAVAACSAIASVGNASTGQQIVSKVAKPDYHPAVEAEGDDNTDNPEFFVKELPYIVSIGKHFCPAEAVRANVI